MSRISVVIPCYNQGSYLEEAVRSVAAQTWKDWEIIIVDDGSDDGETPGYMNSLLSDRISGFSQKNEGLPSARNAGIRACSGDYILTLDADDRIGPDYMQEAARILDEDDTAGIVYCRAAFFGEKQGEWLLPEYTFEGMLGRNLIFCAAFFRKTDWVRAGGFNPAMRHGWEDWDFWLSILELGRSVHRIDSIQFFYRIRQKSMIADLVSQQERLFGMYMQILMNHEKLFMQHLDQAYLGLSRFMYEHVLPFYTVEIHYETQDTSSLPLRQTRTLQAMNVPEALSVPTAGFPAGTGVNVYVLTHSFSTLSVHSFRAEDTSGKPGCLRSSGAGIPSWSVTSLDRERHSPPFSGMHCIHFRTTGLTDSLEITYTLRMQSLQDRVMESTDWKIGRFFTRLPRALRGLKESWSAKRSIR